MSEVVPRPASSLRSGIALFGFLGVTYLVAGVSTTFNVAAIPTWYAALAKPPFNPPNWIFGPVWTILYTLMAIAAWLVWTRPTSPRRKAALVMYGIQLVINFLWSLIFFLEHQIGLAAIEIILLWLAIALTMVLFFRMSKTAGWIFLPYLAWVSFASLLNFAIWRLN